MLNFFCAKKILRKRRMLKCKQTVYQIWAAENLWILYQELKRCYVLDAIECFDEQTPKINGMGRKNMKNGNIWMGHRRQDVGGQATERFHGKPSEFNIYLIVNDAFERLDICT